jgi:hypothetical protein
MEIENFNKADRASHKEKYDIDKQQHELLGDTVTGVRRAPETISYFRNPTIR